MIWGVGCHRSGTMSLAEDLGGVHEPQPRFEYDPVSYQHWRESWQEAPPFVPDPGFIGDNIKGRLVGRLATGKPCVDAAQSYIIPLIREVDPEAEFVWIVRNPFLVVGSLVHASGCWAPHDASDGRKMIYPKKGWPAGTTRIDKAIYYWRETNRIIWQELCEPGQLRIGVRKGIKAGFGFDLVVCPDELNAHTNAHRNHAGSPVRSFSDEVSSRIAEGCWDLWKELTG